MMVDQIVAAVFVAGILGAAKLIVTFNGGIWNTAKGLPSIILGASWWILVFCLGRLSVERSWLPNDTTESLIYLPVIGVVIAIVMAVFLLLSHPTK